MEVQLFVYDLTRGMARAMSRQLLGIHIDAVYHTSLVFGGIEYFFGMGVQSSYPGATHHGQPMEVVPLGTTQLPMETILEYLESLKEVYTPESYDLFEHNCNNFTNDFSMFLVGRGIPDHITNLPRRVLDTPFGQMLKPQLDASMRSITQAPVASPAPVATHRSTAANGSPSASTQTSKPPGMMASNQERGSQVPFGSVINLTSSSALDKHLESAADSAATLFFTSSTCAPCKLAYPTFDQLAGQYPRALFVKIDINSARDIAARFHIRATPTFITFSKGSKLDEWAGATPSLLKANVERLIQQTFPPHPHTLRKVPALQFGSMKPMLFAKTPPLDKLMAKLGAQSADGYIATLRSFVEKKSVDAKDATLPDLTSIGKDFQTKVSSLPVEVRFAAVDLLRCAMADPRVSGFFAEEQGTQTIQVLVAHILGLEECPHNLRLVTIQLACNLFSSSLYITELMRSGNELAPLLVQLITSSLLDAAHPTTRVASASLGFNLAVANYRVRREEDREGLDEGTQLELAASLLETVAAEDNADAIKAMLLSLGYLVYCTPEDGELIDLCKAMDGSKTVMSCRAHDGLASEVAGLL